jgi:hypothetical protein
MRWSLERTMRLACLGVLLMLALTTTLAEDLKKPFTAAIETELWSFIPGFEGSNVHFSPDKKYFVVYCQRGRLDVNRPEDSLRFYRSDDVAAFLKNTAQI